MVICLDCVRHALDAVAEGEAEVECTMCLSPVQAGSRRWRPQDAAASANADAAICEGCLKQAAGAFSKDPDVPFVWKRRSKGQ